MEHETDKELIFRLLYHITSLEIMWSKTFIWNWTRIYCVDTQNYASDKGWVSKFPGVTVLIPS